MALGDKDVLRALIERTQRGVATAEDIKSMTVEKHHLEECIEELKQSLSVLDQKRHDKDEIMKAVNSECELAKDRARQTINELQNLANQMISDKQELDSLGAAKAAIRKEIDGLNRKMSDVASLSQVKSISPMN